MRGADAGDGLKNSSAYKYAHQIQLVSIDQVPGLECSSAQNAPFVCYLEARSGYRGLISSSLLTTNYVYARWLQRRLPDVEIRHQLSRMRCVKLHGLL